MHGEYVYCRYLYRMKQRDMNKLREHNRDVIRTAEYRAAEMKIWASPLEERMLRFLDEHMVAYEFQKIFYIYADDGWIIRYYIADFYIPYCNAIIETDGKFHDEHKQHDKERTKLIQESYPGIEVYRVRWKDMDNDSFMEELLEKIV